MIRNRLFATGLLAAALAACDGNVNDGTFALPLTYRVSVSSGGGEGSGPSGANFANFSASLAISRDGRYIAFSSESRELHPDDPNPPGADSPEIFVRDTFLLTTEIASRPSGPAGAPQPQVDTSPAMSADGRYVAFFASGQLHPDDLDLFGDIYVRDRQTHTTTLVSRATGAAGPKGDAASFFPAISADGRYVAFESQATNLDPADVDGTGDIFVRDLVANTTTLVSRATGAAGVKGDLRSTNPSLSGDGSIVVFESLATTLHPDDLDLPAFALPDIYSRDWQAPSPTTTLVSRRSNPMGVKVGSSTNPVISENGRFVAFSSDGTLEPPPIDLNGNFDIYVRDLQGTNQTFLISRNSAGAVALPPPGGATTPLSAFPSISADGRYVAFSSFSPTLVNGDDNAEADVFQHDRATGKTIRLSVRSFGGQGGPVVPPGIIDEPFNARTAMTADGRYVAFASLLADIVENDNNLTWDVFVRGPIR